MAKIECMFLGGEAYDFVDEKTKQQIKGTSYRFLVGGHETKVKPAKDAKIQGCDLKPAAPVYGELEFDLGSNRGEVVVRFSSFIAKRA